MLRGALISVCLLLSLAADAAAVTDAEVGRAIERMKAHFYATQDPETGGWPMLNYENSQHRGGDTALVTLAMLVAGESSREPRMARAIEYLKQARLTGTYAVALRAHVWAALPEEYRPLLEADAKWLLAAADRMGQFGYGNDPTNNNHSTTQYGVLGLWEASKRGVPVPREFWLGVQDHFIAAQSHDGGFGYQPQTQPYGSMTAAGLTSLLIAEQQLYRDQVAPQKKLRAAIEGGLHWLNTEFDGGNNPRNGGWPYYYLYGIERVALASGVRQLNGRDWFESGATYILSHQSPDNGTLDAGSLEGNRIDTAFGLMFLARGRVPVWASKLAVPSLKDAWNQRPHDLNFLTVFLSEQREQELNWRVVDIDSKPEGWLTTPLLYLSISEEIALEPTQKASLKRYLDLGGMLLVNADNGSAAVTRSVRELAHELYPNLEMRELPIDHWMYRELHHVDAPGSNAVFGVSNGARELILLADRDWGFTFQAETPAGRSPAWKCAANLWSVVTDRGALPNRLVPRYETRAERDATASVTVALAHVEQSPAIPTEPLAWEPVGIRLFNRTGLRVRTLEIDLAEIGDSRAELVHLAGTEPIELTERQREAIERYVKRGGTVLVENVGGRGSFTAKLLPQFHAIFGGTYRMLGNNDPVISGEGIANAHDLRTVAYRRSTLVRLGYSPRPRLGAFMLGARPAVILAQEDLSLGMLGVEHWGILGYRTDTARKIAENFVLSVAPKRKK